MKVTFMIIKAQLKIYKHRFILIKFTKTNTFMGK